MTRATRDAQIVDGESGPNNLKLYCAKIVSIYRRPYDTDVSSGFVTIIIILNIIARNIIGSLGAFLAVSKRVHLIYNS